MSGFTRELFVIGALLSAVPVPATAIGDVPSRHGGEVRAVGQIHAEVSVGEGEVEVFLTDGLGLPLSASGVRGLALVASGGALVPVALVPVEGNVMRGSGPFDNTPEMEILLGIQIKAAQPHIALFDEPR